MRINISGHHVEITEGIETAVNNKFQKIGNHYPELKDISVIVKVDRHEQSVEASTHYQGADLSATACDKDMYTAIQLTAKKLEATLAKRKGALSANRNDKPLGEVIEDSAELIDEASDY